MSDLLMRGVRVQLTTTMDSVLRTAVFEIMRIFESALYEHKMEMAQKGEEIAQLKLKLQTAELKMRDFDLMGQRGAEMTKTQVEPEVVPGVLGKSTTVPEVAVEVPDDWCAPLGYDTATKQEEGFCPSVRLRPFSIRLYPVPLMHELGSHTIKLQKSQLTRRSSRISSMNEKSKATQNKSLAGRNQGFRRPKLSGDLNKLFQNLREDYRNLQNLDRLRKRKTSKETATNKEGKKKDDIGDSSKHSNEQGNHKASDSKAAVPPEVEFNSRNKSLCGNCNRAFDSKRGLVVHLRSQRTCKGCKMVFCFQGPAKYHKEVCAKYKALNKAERHPAKNPPDEWHGLNSRKMQLIIKKEIIQPPVDDRQTSTKILPCRWCNFKTDDLFSHTKHVLSHKQKQCKFCLKKFSKNRSLAAHMRNKHKTSTHLVRKNDHLESTKPSEDVERGLEPAE